jgi:hypothetical protein
VGVGKRERVHTNIVIQELDNKQFERWSGWGWGRFEERASEKEKEI